MAFFKVASGYGTIRGSLGYLFVLKTVFEPSSALSCSQLEKSKYNQVNYGGKGFAGPFGFGKNVLENFNYYPFHKFIWGKFFGLKLCMCKFCDI